MSNEFPAEILSVLQGTGVRISDRLESLQAEQYAQCYDKHKTSVAGFETCALGVKNNTEAAASRLEMSTTFYGLLMQDCLERKKVSDCVRLAHDTAKTLEKNVFK